MFMYMSAVQIGHGMGGAFWGLHWLIWVAWVLAAVVVVALFARLLSGGTDGTRVEDPGDVLRSRLARGEIGIDEFEQRMRALDQDP